MQHRLMKKGGRLGKHARYYWLLLAEGHLNRRLFGDMLHRIWALPLPSGRRYPGKDQQLLAPRRLRSEQCRPECRSVTVQPAPLVSETIPTEYEGNH